MKKNRIWGYSSKIAMTFDHDEEAVKSQEIER